MIYGKNPVFEALRAGRRKVFEVFVAGQTKKLLDSGIVKLARSKNIPVKSVTNPKMNRLGPEGAYQDIAARVGEFPEHRLSEVFESKTPQKLVLVLDCIQDPQNFGTLCRSAVAFGVREVIRPRDRSVGVTPAVCRASAGAVEHLKIISVTNLARALTELKKHGFWIYGASLSDKSVSLQNVNPAPKTAVVLGSEAKGLRPLVAKTCDQLIKIPMVGDFDSLNVAQAGTVLLYDLNSKMFK